MAVKHRRGSPCGKEIAPSTILAPNLYDPIAAATHRAQWRYTDRRKLQRRSPIDDGGLRPPLQLRGERLGRSVSFSNEGWWVTKLRIYFITILATGACLAALMSTACKSGAKEDDVAGAPPPAQVEQEQDGGAFSVDNPGQFALATAGKYEAAPELSVTGTVTPDVSRSIPVVSLASGRIVDIYARLGDSVTKGQLLMRVQSQDISQAFSDYRQAVADEGLARTQFERSKGLFEHGAIAQNDLQIAEDTETKAKVTVETTLDHLRILGADINKPSALVEVHAPASGVITDQQVTAAAGTQGLASPNAFTITDLTRVWVLCDVYENDLPFVRLGEFADVHLNAYPDQLLKGRVGNIGATLDPNLRTAKVRLEVENPGMLRLGMFATATFYGPKKGAFATVPATAVLHLHDRNWVYEPAGKGRFRRVEVVTGKMIPATPTQLQEIISGIEPDQQVVAKALDLQATVEQ
jgi:cobalt-zinc-cadmium efflux system membrane fusion protein